MKVTATAAVVLLLSGCFQATPTDPTPEGLFMPCEHPWPCADGSEWPPGLAGPFEILPPEPARIASFDGIELMGHVWRPDVRDHGDPKVPVIIHSTPYPGQATVSVGAREVDTDPSTSYPGYMETILGEFVRAGYALLLVNVRGTGESGGCLGWWGEEEQRDQALLVAWAAQQPWSNGRVGFWGLSYSGTTPWEAAIQAPPALKAIWAGGVITDPYLLGYSVQGSADTGYAPFATKRFVENSLAPPIPGVTIPLDRFPAWAGKAGGRVCPDTPDDWLRQARTVHMDDRDAAWFLERRLVQHFPNVTAAVLVPHGLQDNSGHRFQDDVVWAALPNAPRWMLFGQWGHTFQFDEQLEGHPTERGHLDLTLRWFDFWLKGLGPAPRLATDYQDTSGAWHASASWPPAEARAETLFLAEGELRPLPGSRSATFTAPSGLVGLGPEITLDRPLPYGCEARDPTGTWLAYTTRPANGDVVVAGNPHLLLQLSSDRPGGQFVAELWELPSGDWCAGDAELMARGAADLRFHTGGYVGADFPVGQAESVRVDLWNLAHRVDAGHQVGVLLAAPVDQDGQPWSPALTVHADGGPMSSQVVLPVVGGTLGGSPPEVAHPGRPFEAPGPAAP